MNIITEIFIALIALIHCYILWLEMFAWETRGKVVFKNALKPELFTPTKSLAANQGLYNGFLAAGLVWSLLISDPIWQTNIATFFLACVAIAGMYGALTADKKILFVQTIPATIALIFLYIFK
jgi:putative membrane protein